MRKILPLIFLITISLKLSFALTPKDIIKQGTRLVYDINKNGNNYELTVIINNISKHYAVDWTLNGSTKLKGNLLLNNDSLDTTYQIFTLDNITPECIIKLNKKIFEIFEQNSSCEIYTDKNKDIKTIFGNPISHTQSFGYNNNLSYEFDCKTVNDGGDYQITYVNNADLPLIVEMNMDWTMKLKNIYNK